MNYIKAFVAHSFAKSDEILIDKFLKYFDQLGRLDPTFSWEHAEAAEPRQLMEKVLARIADKNVFIGICTKAERVVHPNSLSEVWLQPLFQKARKTDFGWKTSDWIIQEIGLAKGRGLELVLLIEQGLRDPGGLQGDVEYISFERDAPERSFGKITEMLAALSPKTANVSTTSSDIKSADTPSSEVVPPDTDDWKTPQLSWNRRDYENAMLRMMFRDDEAGIAAISAAYLNTPDANQTNHRATWAASIERWRFVLGNVGNLGKLRELADAHPDSSYILECLAYGTAQYEDHVEAAKRYEEAAKVAESAKESYRLLGLAATEQIIAGNVDASSRTISKIKAGVEAHSITELQLLSALREVAKSAKNENMAVAVMERIVELAPDDISTRFSLAYAHSELGNNDLALLHYRKIPYNDRNQTAWNNLGVSYSQFSMPGKSVQAYQKAAEMGETLAMSNLANIFMSEGLLDLAQAECDRALKVSDYHKNVAIALTRLREIPEEEQKKVEELLVRIKPKHEFYRSYGQAVTRTQPADLAGKWQGPDCALDVEIVGSAFKASGSYERDQANALAPKTFGLLKLVARYRLEYSGIVTGKAIEGFVSRIHGGESTGVASILGLGENKTKVLLVLNDEGTELKVMENPHGTTPTFYSLARHPVSISA